MLNMIPNKGSIFSAFSPESLCRKDAEPYLPPDPRYLSERWQDERPAPLSLARRSGVSTFLGFGVCEAWGFGLEGPPCVPSPVPADPSDPAAEMATSIPKHSGPSALGLQASKGAGLTKAFVASSLPIPASRTEEPRESEPRAESLPE